MGLIHDDVLSGLHLRKNPRERPLLVPFLHSFDVTRAEERRTHNTVLSIYYLQPDEGFKRQFGIDSEVLMVMSHFGSVQPRTLQAVEQVMLDFPARGRVDPGVFFLVTPDSNAKVWLSNHASLNAQARIPVVFSNGELSEGPNSWLVRNSVSEQLFSRDLFNDQLPLRNDSFFVGRDQIVAEVLAAVKDGHNRGLFGLRKTGKTSLLFKVQRLADRDGLLTFYYDCKDPAIRSLDWERLIERMMDDITSKLPAHSRKPNNVGHISDKFRNVISQCSKLNKKVLIIFDEIEYVSPLAKRDLHWHTDFIDFWQTMWSIQSQIRSVSFVIAGVNPLLVETDVFDGIQNPIFGIVSPQYLTGLDNGEVINMLHHIGRWMGMNFDDDASLYMAAQYGGHPHLTRMASSYIHLELLHRKQKRPVRITERYLRLTASARDNTISGYSRYIISELKSFYPMEYEMLEMLSAGNVAEFFDLSFGADYTRHLVGYGLVDVGSKAKPIIKIPVISRFINQQRAQRTRSPEGPYIIEPSHRASWLSDRLVKITRDVRQMERLACQRNLPKLYGENGFPEAELFAASTVCIDSATLASFVNTCNRCFVESIERYGRSIGKKITFGTKSGVHIPTSGMRYLE